jgi:phage-related holin
MDINKMLDWWQLKIVASIFTTFFTFLIGEINVPLVALALLVVIDTFSRWGAIANKKLADKEITASIWYGVYLAIHERDINSQTMRGKLVKKILGYLILLIGFNLVSKIIPDTFFGTDISKAPTVFISSWLAFVELQSIIENLVDMGFDALKPLLFWCISKRQALSGVAEENGDHKE